VQGGEENFCRAQLGSEELVSAEEFLLQAKGDPILLADRIGLAVPN
jgi:hypothetical protein